MPKALPGSLEVLNLGDDPFARSNNKFTGGIPSEWGVLTNLKELKVANCGFDGKLLSTLSGLSYFADISFFWQEDCLRNWPNLPT